MHTLRWKFFLTVSLTFLGSSKILKGPLLIHGYHFHAANFCQNPVLFCFFLCTLPALISFCPEAWDETRHLVDNITGETHW